MKKRRQHYVWKHYLEPWTTGGQIACLRAGKIFSVNPINVAVEQDFYRLQEMTDADLLLVRHLIKQSTPQAQDLHGNWLKMFTDLFDLRRRYEANGRTDASIERKLDASINNLEEDLHAFVEDAAGPLLASLQRGDTRFFADGESFATFMHFLSLQYMRTKVTRDRVLDLDSEPSAISAARVFGVLRHIFATNMGATFVERHQHIWVVLLYAAPGTEFIAGDQPVINTYAIGKPSDTPPAKLEFYYPVTPTTAVLIGDEREKPAPPPGVLSVADVERYNDYIASESGEQLYASSESVLRHLQLKHGSSVARE